MSPDKAATVDEFVAAKVLPQFHPVVALIRQLVQEEAPGTVEAIAYGVPTFRGRAMLAECLRVLKPGGRIRISTPDMAFLVALEDTRQGPDREKLRALAARYPTLRRTVEEALVRLREFAGRWGAVDARAGERAAALIQSTRASRLSRWNSEDTSVGVVKMWSVVIS